MIQRTDAAFARLDANHDGRFTREEAQAHAAQQRREQMRTRMFERLDADNNGQISREEFAQAPRAAAAGAGRGGPGGPGPMAEGGPDGPPPGRPRHARGVIAARHGDGGCAWARACSARPASSPPSSSASGRWSGSTGPTPIMTAL